MAWAADKPLFIYDGACAFCRLWIERWRVLVGSRVQFTPFQQLTEPVAGVTRKQLEQSVWLITTAGSKFSAAHAAFKLFSLVPGHGKLLWLYERVPGFARLAELAYGVVSRHRSFFYQVTRLCSCDGL